MRQTGFGSQELGTNGINDIWLWSLRRKLWIKRGRPLKSLTWVTLIRIWMWSVHGGMDGGDRQIECMAGKAAYRCHRLTQGTWWHYCNAKFVSHALIWSGRTFYTAGHFKTFRCSSSVSLSLHQWPNFRNLLLLILVKAATSSLS